MDKKQIIEEFKQKFYKDLVMELRRPDHAPFYIRKDVEKIVEKQIDWLSNKLDKVIEKEQEVDHSIDVRYEEDVIVAFDKFIKKWCGVHYPHLIDNDQNDGEFMREKIEELKNNK